jgi:hypothetical protein
MVSVLDSSAVDRGFEPWSGQTKTMKLVFVASPSFFSQLKSLLKTLHLLVKKHKYQVNFQWDDDEFRFVLVQHA